MTKMSQFETAYPKAARTRSKSSGITRGRRPHRPAAPERAMAPLRNSPHPIIGLQAEFRREDYVYARMQSYAMRNMEWEERAEPIRSWGFNVVADLAWRYFG
jgi:hypothetical protein